jgi:hypothetical protein
MLNSKIRTEAVGFMMGATRFTIKDRIELERIGYAVGENVELERDLDAIAFNKMNNRDMRLMRLYAWLKER